MYMWHSMLNVTYFPLGFQEASRSVSELSLWNYKLFKCDIVTTYWQEKPLRIYNRILAAMHLKLKDAPSGLRKILATESPLKMMKNAFYFASKALFILKIFRFSSWLFGHAAKPLDKKDQVSFKFYDVTAWLRNNFNTHIAQYFEN